MRQFIRNLESVCSTHSYFFNQQTIAKTNVSAHYNARRVASTAEAGKRKWGPRSKAEFWGLCCGAAVFPISVALLNYYEGQRVEWQPKPDIAPEFVNPEGKPTVAVTTKPLLGGPFTLTDAKTGKRITDKELFKDHWTLLYFGFSKCAEICPNTLKYLTEVLKTCDAKYGSDPETAKEQKRLQVAFLSIDFIRDKPEVVQKFVSKYEPRVRGLCGSKSEVEGAARAWRVYYSSVDETDEEREIREKKGVDAPEIDDNFQFDHSSAIYLVGPDGKMKDFFFKEMGLQDTVDRIGVHYEDVYGFSNTDE